MTTEGPEQLDKPWWYWRCTHRNHPYAPYSDGSAYGCWQVVQEAEQAVVLHLVCKQQVHICVDIAGVGGSCKAITSDEWAVMSDQYLLALVQDMARELRSIAGM